MTIKERQLVIKEFSKEILEATRIMESLGYKEHNIELVLEEVIKNNLKKLNDYLTMEYEKGNYIVCGGDFNHDIANSIDKFDTTQEIPSWVYELKESDLCDNFSFATSSNAPTCRSTDLPYTKGINYSVVVDGFIVSNNVEVIEITNIDNDFLYSDHNPVYLDFSLNQ